MKFDWFKKTLLIVALLAAVCLLLVGCATENAKDTPAQADKPQTNTSQTENTTWTLNTAYLRAQNLGYTGTLEEFLATIQGKDGIGITAIEINDEGELVVTFSDTRTVNLGRVVGRDGQDNMADLQALTDEYSAQVTALTAETTANAEAIAALQAELAAKDRELAQLQAELDAANTASADELTALRAELAAKELELAQLQAELDAVREQSSPYGFVLKEDGTYELAMAVNHIMKADIPAAYNGKAVTSIGNIAFNGCRALTTVTIPDSVTSIGQSAFSSCTSLTSVTIPDSVTSIGQSAFSSCTSLTCVTIPDSVTSIGGYAFRDCMGLTSVTIGSGVTSISQYAFYNCTSLTCVTIPDSVTSIGTAAFSECTCLTNITIPNSVTSIGNSAFEYCMSLTSITIPESVTSIGELAFYGCTGLTGVYITDVAKWCSISFGNHTANPLYYAHNLYVNDTLVTELVIPDGVTSIGDYTFCGCTGLTSVVIPDCVTSIGSSAFSGCSSVVSMIIPFVGGMTGKTANSTYQYPFGYIFGEGGYTGGTATKQAYYGRDTNGKTSSTYYIPSTLRSVTVLGEYIPEGAFNNCSNLTNIIIGDGVTNIGHNAFSGCTNLIYNVYGSEQYLGNEQNPYAVLIQTTDTQITSCTIHEKTRLIADYAFYNCSKLTHITISNSVKRIGALAFWKCTKLNSITFRGSVEQWNLIDKENGWAHSAVMYWNCDTGSYTVHCTDGDIAKADS